MADRPLVLLVGPTPSQYSYAEALAKAGFRSASIAAEHVDIAHVLKDRPAVIAAELDGAAPLDLVRSLRQNQQTRLIPFVIYGHRLRPEDIENAARAGALWLQLEPSDGARLVAAARGLIAASLHDGL